MDSEMFFDGWHGIVRVLVLGVIGYVALIAMLRVSRKRSLSKMNVFDFVYIVVMGELLAITIFDDRVALAEGMVVLETNGALSIVVHVGAPSTSSALSDVREPAEE